MARDYDEPFSLYGLLAESIEVSDDCSSITFPRSGRKRAGRMGASVTAHDVLFSFRTLRDKGKPNYRTYYAKVANAEKLDDRRVKFTFARDAKGMVDREMPSIMGLMPILPEHDWKTREFSKTTLRIPIGSGPYRVETFDPGRSITYSRDPNYWGRDIASQKGLYNFDKIRIDYYRDENISASRRSRRANTICARNTILQPLGHCV